MYWLTLVTYPLIVYAANTNFLDYLSRASIITFLILVVYGGYKQWWVFGWQYKEANMRCDDSEERERKMEVEKNAWRDTALKAGNIATAAFEETTHLDYAIREERRKR